MPRTFLTTNGVATREGGSIAFNVGGVHCNSVLIRTVPTSDVSAGTWTASAGGSLFAAIDDNPIDDTDFISTTGASITVIALPAVTNPGKADYMTIVFRATSAQGGKSLIVRLKQGATIIAAQTQLIKAAAIPITYRLILTPTQVASITDFTNLRLELEAL